MTFTIEDNVEIPETAKPNRITEVLFKMNVGQSFFAAGLKHSSVRTPMQHLKKRKNNPLPQEYKVICRAVKEGGIEGIRVWRTA